MKSKLCLSIFLVLCLFSFNQVQAEELTATDFEQIDILFPIENEETRITLSADDTVIASTEEEAVSPGEGDNGEIGENGESGSTNPDPETICHDPNCSKCATIYIGTCETCKTGFEAVGGMCQTPANPNTPAPTIKGRLSVSMRWNGNLALVEKLGGKPFIRAKLAEGLGLSVAEVNVTDVTYGSIIVAFDLFTLSSSTLTATQLKSLVDTYGNKKDDKLDIFGEGIMDYYGSKIVVTAGGCPSGYYADASNVCQTCEDGCETCDSDGKCSKTNVGAIVGGVLGGLALILIIVVGYIKRDVLLKGCSSLKKNRSAAYNQA